jgi:hypothetical protein
VCASGKLGFKATAVAPQIILLGASRLLQVFELGGNDLGMAQGIYKPLPNMFFYVRCADSPSAWGLIQVSVASTTIGTAFLIEDPPHSALALTAAKPRVN